MPLSGTDRWQHILKEGNTIVPEKITTSAPKDESRANSLLIHQAVEFCACGFKVQSALGIVCTHLSVLAI